MLDWITEPVRALLAGWRRERLMQRDIAELKHLDDRMLADLGIARGQIEDYVRGRLGHDAIALQQAAPRRPVGLAVRRCNGAA
ncbi:hypothetical protein LNKW23_14920 [Paralimibaculum aggregatum]|uniref:YjiS-like domain-containing protein n=1 Tax=Paralimibaculum aggregatum TaxID=3036245 RepID=A0ABQ6LG34_9RHOB|nr:DUF1127 domain-containing protein [Limibaculum sp. NKW23]GMG82279.1 hypothetical protein LNKW23_14920 [Limibaculum sp. NKW23]